MTLCSRMMFFGAIWLVAAAGVLDADIIGVTGFTQIGGAIFYDARPFMNIPTVTLGNVTVTPNPSLVNTDFVYQSQLSPDVPGNNAGFGSSPTDSQPAPSLTLNFSEAVAAVGATFQHQDLSDDHRFGFPVNLQVFSGLDGTGVLRGSITDPGGGAGGTFTADFRGLWSTNLDIRSAVISPTSPSGGWLVDGFAISLSPAPEPDALKLGILGFTALGILAAVRHHTRVGLRKK